MNKGTTSLFATRRVCLLLAGVLVLSAMGCNIRLGTPDAPPEEPAKPEKPQITYEEVLEQPQQLEIAADGSAFKRFHLVLATGDKDKKIFVPFQFTNPAFTLFKVEEPEFELNGCTGKVTLPGMGWGGEFLLLLGWNPSWVRTKKPAAQMGYGIEEEVKPGAKETLTLVFYVPKDCTEVKGEFRVFFR